MRLFSIITAAAIIAFLAGQISGNELITQDRSLISFRSTDHDFGTIPAGAEAKHYFVFTNEGKSPLVIMNVRTACGCMVPSWPREPIAPGKKDSLAVEYNTKIRGTFSKTITVQSNSSTPSVELKISGTVVKTK